MKWLKEHLNVVVVVISVVTLIIYIVIAGPKNLNNLDVILKPSIMLLLATFSFFGSILIVVVSLGSLNDEKWFGDFGDYQLYFFVGCLVAALFTGVEIAKTFVEVLK